MKPKADITVIACGVLEDEVRHHARGEERVRRLIFLPQALHNEPTRLREALRRAIAEAEADEGTEAIALVYGLCSRAVEETGHRRCALAIARAHDCVTLLLGSRERYEAERREHPGTYWHSPGWIESGAPPGPEREARLRREYTEKFGEEEAEYLIEMEREGLAGYTRAVYVGLGAGETEDDARRARECAACLGWSFERMSGDPALLRDLIGGRWDEGRFLVVPPRHVIRPTGDSAVIRAAPEASAGP